MSVFHQSRFHYDIFKPDHWANLLWLLAPESQQHDNSKFEAIDFTVLQHYLIVNEKVLRPQLEITLEKPSLRLGKYCEQLMNFALEVCADYTVHCAGLQVSDAGRTLGELDYVLSGPGLDMMHIEMAVKFYLQLPSGELLGPGLKDSLLQKERHLSNVQLPMSSRKCVVALLADKGIKVKGRRVFMPMRLFAPYDGSSFNGTWISVSEFSGIVGCNWYPVPRLCWPGVDQLDVARATRVDVLDRFFEGGRQPTMLRNELGDLVFLVDDDWQQKAESFVLREKQGES